MLDEARASARAVLKELRKPTKDMLGAGLWAAAPDDRENEEAMKRAWQAMIDKALEE